MFWPPSILFQWHQPAWPWIQNEKSRALERTKVAKKYTGRNIYKTVLWLFVQESSLHHTYIIEGIYLKALLFSKGQKLNRGAQKMNLFTTLVELLNYDSRNLCNNKSSFFEHLYGSC